MKARKMQISFSSQLEFSQHRCQKIQDHRTKVPHLNQTILKIPYPSLCHMPNPIYWCHCFRSLGSLWLTIESRCISPIREMVFQDKYPLAFRHHLSQVFGPPILYRRSTTFTSMTSFCYKTCNVIVYRSCQHKK